MFGADKSLSDEVKTKKAQKIYDAVLAAFPQLRAFMFSSQKQAHDYGYVETILGRRRHIPEMQLDEFEFKPLPGYVNPDIDPLDMNTLDNKEEIPQRYVDQLKKEFASYKYFGQVVKRTKELYDEKIKVINNRAKITDASRECVNCVDEETEILTTSGWKRYNEVKEGDEILSYSFDTQSLQKDQIKAVHIYPGERKVVGFKSSTFDALSTPDHRWVSTTYKSGPRFVTTDHIRKNAWPDYPILRIAGNCFEDNPNYSDDELSQHKDLNEEFIFSLSQRQASIVLQAMLCEDQTHKASQSIVCETLDQCDILQLLCVIAGVSTKTNLIDEKGSYSVSLLPGEVVSVYPEHKYETTVNLVWCVSTGNETWIARRNGKVYITGNSRVQGSAADLTKMAMIRLDHNKRWKELGARLLVPIHDELLCEAPIENQEEAAQILSKTMQDAGSFLPFPISCDVTTTYRWYGIALNDEYQEPEQMNLVSPEGLSESNIKWIQSYILECEYLLPVFKEPNGDKPRGDAARGVNGIWTDELAETIQDYLKVHRIPIQQFVKSIKSVVELGHDL